MVDLTQAHKASIELLGTRHTALVEAVRNYVNGSVQPSIDELIAAIEDVTTAVDTKEKMLLGLASRQATKPVPSLILDFKTRHYLQGTRRPEKGYGIHDLLTVERATPKWVYSASGKLTEVPDHEPAYQHDPVTGEPQGLLIEEERTNLLLWSEDFTNGAWEPQNSNTVVEVYQGGSPAPSTYLVKAEQSFQSISSEIRQSGLSINEGPLSIFLLCKPLGEVNGVGFYTSNYRKDNRSPLFDFRDKTVSGGDGSIVELNDGWFLCEQKAVATSSGGEFFGFRPAKDGEISISANEGEELMLASLAQYSYASMLSSYIPTTDSPMTRAADNVSRVLGDEFNPVEGTIFVELDVARAKQETDTFATSILSFGEPGRNCTFTLYTSKGDRRNLSFRLYGPVETETISAYMLSDVHEGTVKIAASYNVTTGAVFLSTLGQSISEQWLFDSYYSDAPELLLNRLGRKGETRYSSPSQEFLDLRYYPYAMTEQELIDLTS